MKRILLLLGALGVFFIAAAIILLLWIPHWFLGSETFRQEMNRQTNSTLNLRGEWLPFQLEGWTLNSPGYQGTTGYKNYQADLSAEQVSFQINWRSLFKRKWDIKAVAVQKLNLQLSTLSEPLKLPEMTAPPEAPGISKLMIPFIPQTVDIKEILLPEVAVSLKTEKKTDSIIRHLAAHSISDGHDHWNTSISKGTFTPSGRLPWKLNSARLTGNLEAMTLEGAEFIGQGEGTINISGPVLVDGKPDASLKLIGKGIPLNSIVPLNWKSFVAGRVDGSATALINRQGVSLQGKAEGQDVVLIGIPALRAIHTATGIREWTELPLSKAWTEFTYSNHDLHIQASAFESNDLIKLEGQLRVKNNELSGTYQVGVSERVVTKIPGAQQTVFTSHQSNYYWAQPPMSLSGTIDQPKEDLSPRLKSAAFDAIEQKIHDNLGKGLNIFNSLLEQIP